MKKQKEYVCLECGKQYDAPKERCGGCGGGDIDLNVPAKRPSDPVKDIPTWRMTVEELAKHILKEANKTHANTQRYYFWEFIGEQWRAVGSCDGYKTMSELENHWSISGYKEKKNVPWRITKSTIVDGSHMKEI